MHAIGEILLDILLKILFWVLILPLSMIIATPVILVGAIFIKQSYGESVKAGYYSVYQFWDKLTSWWL